MMEDEYELIPLNPIRRLEKRVEQMEKSSTTQEVLEELMSIIKTNQQVVDNMTRTNTAMMNKVVDLSNDVDKMIRKIDDFINRLETQPVQEEKGSDTLDKFDERLSKMEKRINSVLLTSMARKGLVKRPMEV